MTRIQFRRGTTSQFTAANPILAAGEPAIDSTTKILKVGDGVTNWNSMPPALGGVLVCTSTTRPTAPYAGLLVYESNTGNYSYWTGAAWADLSTHPSFNTRYASLPMLPVWFGPGIPQFGTSSGVMVPCQITIPAQTRAGRLMIWSHLRFDTSAAGDTFQIYLSDGSTLSYLDYRTTVANQTNVVNPIASVAMVAATPKTITLNITRASGAGTASVAATTPTNRLECLFVPT